MSTSTILYINIATPAEPSTTDHDPSPIRRTLVRRVIDKCGGHVTRSVGDVVIAVFGSAFDSVHAAISLQQDVVRNASPELRIVGVRAGINIGEVIAGDSDAFDAAVAVARQLCDLAAPGQILATDMIEHLLRRSDVAFEAIEVAGLPETEHAYEVVWEPAAALGPLIRVVVADDAGLLRVGIIAALAANGFDVVAEAADFDTTIAAVTHHKPELLITDIRMPPTHSDEGIRAALALRPTQPELAVLVLSQYVDARAAIQLLDGVGAGVGYLLKERVTEVNEFVDAALAVLGGQTVIDPTVAERMMARRSVNDATTRLSEREREVLAQMATGASNTAIAQTLFVSSKTVESHVNSILTKLDLPDIPEGNRRVQAVLRFLEATR